MKYTFKAGAGRRTITPQVGCMMQGYTPRRSSTSLHDDLHVTAFAVEVNGVRAMLASMEVVSCPTSTSERIRHAMADAAGVPFDNILLSTVHTHSGPVMANKPDGTPEEPEYIGNVLIPMCAEAAKDAVEALQTAEMGVGQVESTVGINRRQITEAGTVILGQEPFALHDPRMTVVSFRSAETKKTIGNMVFYGCHNTGSGENREITRDWCGVMIDRMDTETGGLTAFFNGCQGSAGPRLANGKTTGNIQLALELGGLAAVDGMRAWRSIREWRSRIELKTVQGQIALPYDAMPSREYLLKRIAEFPDPSTLRGGPLIEYNGLNKQLALLDSPEANETDMVLDMKMLAFGPIAFVPLPFETFSMITMRIIRQSPFPYTVCMSHGNGANGYFPSQDQLCMGGYEVKGFKVHRAHPLADGDDQVLIRSCTELLRKMNEQ